MNYPNDIKPLTGLRFFAAFWLLLYFFWGRLGFGEAFFPNIIKMGYMGVDLFFILSGFVLAHVYGPQFEKEKYSYGSFVWARLARVYPLHLICLLAMIGIWAIGVKIGANFAPKAFDVSQLPFHIALLQAWGTVKSDGWNFPSWSISAEWFAYLTFPITYFIGLRFKKLPILGLVFACLIFYGLYAVLAAQNIELTNMTWQGGVVRIIPSFMAGIMLWMIGRKTDFGGSLAQLGFATSLLFLAVVCIYFPSPLLVWPALLGIVFFIAETSKYEGKTLLSRWQWVYLGEISFAMYMVHLPVDIVFSKALETKFGPLEGLIGSVSFFGGILLTMIGAVIAHEYIEKPARNYMRGHVPSFFQPKKKGDKNPITQAAE